MTRKLDLTGHTYGRLEVLEEWDLSKDGRISWLCVCDCGALVEVRGTSLRSSNTTSCGCVRREQSSISLANTNRKHGGARTRLYKTWANMRQRCSNPFDKDYRRYGARGIKVCDEWESFEIFMLWAIDNGYRDHLTIDRINNDGNYVPDNCQWITNSENSKKMHKDRIHGTRRV